MNLVPLSRVCRLVNGGTPKSGVADYWGGDVAWLTPAEMGKRDTPEIETTIRTITDSGLRNSSARQVPIGSVIMSTRAPIGHLAIPLAPMAFNQGCRGLVPNEHLEAKYLYYFLSYSRDALDNLGTGTTFKELSTSVLGCYKIPLPSTEEQRRIVNILDQAFAVIASATANAEKNLANAREIIAAEVQCLFRNQGDGWWEYKLPEISSNWDSRRRPVTKADRIAGDVPYYGASGQVDRVRDYLFEEDLLLVSEDGANLLMRTYPIAFSVSGKSWVNNHAHVLKFHDAATQRLVEYYLNSISLRRWVSGMAQPKLNQKALNEIPIALPPSSSRQELVLRLDFIADGCEALTSCYGEKLGELAALKQTLLHRAFSGELTGRKPLAA